MDTEKHTIDFFVNKTWARHASLTSVFAGIAIDSYISILSEEKELIKKPEDYSKYEDYLEQQELLLQLAIKTIVFSAMTMEAAIYDLGAIHLSDKYVSENLDKLDLVSKWIVYPQLICGSSFKENSPALNSLKALNASRNKLVHYKSFSHENMHKSKAVSSKVHQGVKEGFKCIVLTSLELNKILKTPAGILPMFEKEYIRSKEHSKLLVPIINKCRQIHARNYP